MVQTHLNCVHQHYLNNDVHKLITQNGSNEAVDEALVHLKRIIDNHLEENGAETTLRLFIDARAGVPPLQYFFSSLRKLYATYDALPTIRAVYVYEESVVLSLIQMFFNALRMNASRRFIKNGTDVEALEWVLSDDDI